MNRIRVLIAGAAGRDFHNFNLVYRGREEFQVVGFTATQIPNIDGRVYPPQLAGGASFTLSPNPARGSVRIAFSLPAPAAVSLGVFDIAGLGSSTDLLPFFSRRVGLLGDRAVPIRAGAKVIGRQSDYNVGILDVHTPGQNLLAARVSRNLFDQSWIGGIVTRGDPAGERNNTLVGGDARFATSTFRGDKNLAFEMFLLGTDNGGERDGAGGVRLDYPNDRWDLAVTGGTLYLTIGEDLFESNVRRLPIQ